MLKFLGFRPTIGTQWLFSISVCLAVYLYLFNIERGPTYHTLVLVLPYWALISLGSYALLSIGINLALVKDCPEDSKELNFQILQARRELSEKGFKF